jgi:hypothetical protein
VEPREPVRPVPDLGPGSLPPPSAGAAGPGIRPGSAGRPAAPGRAAARHGRTRWRRAARRRGARAASGASRRPGAAAAPPPRRRTPAPRSPGPRPGRPAWPRWRVEPFTASGPSVARARCSAAGAAIRRHLLQRGVEQRRSRPRPGCSRRPWRGRRSAAAPGVALADQVQRVAQVEAGIERPEPFSRPSARARRRRWAGAAGPSRGRRRCRPRLHGRRGRTAPARGGASWPAGSGFSASSSSSACSRMPALHLAALAVDGVQLLGQLGGARGSSVTRHSMPSVMSASRPAALMRGPSAKPKSKAAGAPGRGRRRRTAPPRPAACARRGCA